MIDNFLVGSCYSIVSFMCIFCSLLFVFFRLAIVLPVILRFADFDYLFGIFKLILNYSCSKCASLVVYKYT